MVGTIFSPCQNGLLCSFHEDEAQAWGDDYGTMVPCTIPLLLAPLFMNGAVAVINYASVKGSYDGENGRPIYISNHIIIDKQ